MNAAGRTRARYASVRTIHQIDTPRSPAFGDDERALATTQRPPTETPSHALLNRELSWLDLNARVLDLAADPSEPLLERVKFCAIFSSNLDEFFMVRVAGPARPGGRARQRALARRPHARSRRSPRCASARSS